MKVKAVKRFHDVMEKKIRKKDEQWDVPKERGEHLIRQGMAVEVKETEKVKG